MQTDLSNFLMISRPYSPGYENSVQVLHKVLLIGQTVSKVVEVIPSCDDFPQVQGGIVVDMLPILPVKLAQAARGTMQTNEAQD